MKVFIAGYYGAGNLGDDLILSAILSQLKERNPQAQPTVLSVNPKETSRLFHVEAVHKWNVVKGLMSLDEAELFILGGGGLIQDKTSLLSLAYYLFWVEAAIALGIPVFVYAVGVERVASELGRSWVRRVFSHDQVKLTVRDLSSKELLEQWGVNGDKVFVTGDPVLTRRLPKVQPRSNKNGKDILLIPRVPSNPEDEAWLERLIKASSELGTVRVLIFQPDLENRLKDSSWASQVEWLAPATLSEPGSFETPFQRSDLVVSERFHGLVLAGLANKPMAGFGNPDKVRPFCQARGAPFLEKTMGQDEAGSILKSLLKRNTDEPDQTWEIWVNSADLTRQLLP